MERETVEGKEVEEKTNSKRKREKTKRGYKEKQKQRHTAQKKVGGYREGELPVAIATAGTLVQSPRQCLVARERFRRREKGARQAAPLFPADPSEIRDR